MKRTTGRPKHLLLVLSLFMVACVGPQPDVRNGPTRNVLLLIADDQGLDLGCYGNTVIQTPHQDKLASQGVRFTHAFSTAASCSTNRSVILTGLYNHTNGQYGHSHGYHNFHTLSWVETLPYLLKKEGYRTGIIGKFHVAPEELYPFDFQADGKELMGGRNVSLMAQKARDFFSESRTTPFYLHVGFSDPHRSGKRFANDRDYPGIKVVSYSPSEVSLPSHMPDIPEARQEMAEYYQSVSRLDQGVGLILEALKDTGKDHNTLVIYLSDNGISFPGAKLSLYDPGVRLPLIISSPEQSRRGVVNHAMVSFLDLLPTILEWANVSGPSYPLPGRSLLPILEQENPEGWDQVFLSRTFIEVTTYYPSRGVRTRKYKYINHLLPQLTFPFGQGMVASEMWKAVLRRNITQLGIRSVDAFLHRPSEELYDLEKDPDEAHNLAGDARYAPVLRDLRQRVSEFQKKTNDPWYLHRKTFDPLSR